MTTKLMDATQTFSLLSDASHRAFPTGRHGSVLKRLKFVLRSWPYRNLHIAWYEFLHSNDLLRRLAEYDHRMYRKLYRPYVSASWDKPRVLAALKTNYTFFREKLPPYMLEEIFLSDSFLLAEWSSGNTYQLKLSHDEKFYQEGEVTMSLSCPGLGEGSLALLSGTFAPAQDGAMAFYIGGIQGAARSLGIPAIKTAGRDMHGLRPKSLIVIAAQLLANQLGCKHILASSAAQHVYREDDRRRGGKHNKMFFDYDSFWEECMGTRINDAFYSIPMLASRRRHEDMKPQKRPMYRRRYEMLDEIENALSRALTP